MTSKKQVEAINLSGIFSALQADGHLVEKFVVTEFVSRYYILNIQLCRIGEETPKNITSLINCIEKSGYQVDAFARSFDEDLGHDIFELELYKGRK